MTEARESSSGEGMSVCFDDNTAVEFIDGLLSAAEEQRVERHAARCDSCRQLLAELGRSPSLAELSPTLPAGGDAHISVQTGQQVGRFVVLSRIGAGGMGVVFAAFDPKLDRKVALKLLHSPDSPSVSEDEAQSRLLREAQAIAQLSHPNVISVYDVGMYRSEVYIAMEFVEGDTLTRWQQRWERPWQDVLGKFVQAGKALVDAHAAGLVHRDFKPDNVLVGNDGRVRVMDFGLARWLYAADGPADQAAAAGGVDERGRALTDRALDRRLTATGALLGTPRYMAPEQFAGLPADARSDQFSFCVALYESLYKQHPFADNMAMGLVEAPDTTEVRPPPADTAVPAWLHKALLRGLATDPMERYASMGALLRALAPAPPPPPRLRWLAPIFVALVAVGSAAYLYHDRGVVESQKAELESERDALEQRLGDLEGRFDRLGRELERTRQQLKEAREQPSEVVELRRQLAETRAELVATLDELAETQAQLARVTEERRAGRPDRQPRLTGLSAKVVRKRIFESYWDLDTCFREWRERERRDQPTFAVRLEIDSRGVPRRGSRSGGIPDRVVHECVAGLLETLRFPASDGVTVVDLGFRDGEDDQVTVSARVHEVLPAVEEAPPEITQDG